MKNDEYWCVKCPYYCGEDKRKIICEGLEDGTFLHIFFPTKAILRDFRHRRCVMNYHQCPIALMLDKKYEEE